MKMTEVQQYTPKVGDRVRVTYTCEGEVTSAGYETFLMKGVDSENLPFERCYVHDPKPEHLSFEKLADYNPEPTWVNGDVIAAGGTIWMRSGGAWRSSDNNGWVSDKLITNYWLANGVEILYKADAQKETA